jgi:hypothetical protein
LAVFGLEGKSLTAGELWQHIYQQLRNDGALPKREAALNVILSRGSLSTRIIDALGSDLSWQSLTTVYKELSACLAENRMFF